MKTITRFCANKLTTVLAVFVALLSISLFNFASAHALTVTTSPTAGTLSLPLTPSIFNKVSQTITVDNTNYHAGYTMTLETAGYEYLNPNTPGSQAPEVISVHTNDLVNTTSPTDTTKRIPTLSSTITSSNDFNNNWGYSFFNTNIAADDPLRNTFYPVPGYTTGTNPTPIQDTLATTTTSTTPDTYELSFGAKVDTSVPAGTYQNDIVVRVVSNPTTCSGGNICYDENYPADSTTSSPTSMGNQTIASTDTEATLWASNYQRSGYGFAGWNTKADGTGTSYGPNQTITDSTVINEIKNNGLVLYAMWKQSTGNLQSYSASTCAAMNIGDTTALTDTRDGNTYAIAKLADGNCWMIENLRLSNTHTTTGAPVVINSTNTNNPDSGFTSLPNSSDSWCAEDTVSCIDQSILNTNNTKNTKPIMTNPDSNVYSYGNYYNWYTATAGNGTYSMTNGSTAGDICPAGWHLPIGGNNGDFSELSTALGGYIYDWRWRSFPNNFIYSGMTSSSSLSYRGDSGSYISSTAAFNNRSIRLLDVYFDEVNYGDNLSVDKFRGLTSRCLLSTTYTINYDSNGGSGTMNPQTIEAGQATNLSANTFTRDNFIFNGWNTDPNGNGTSYTNEQSVTDLTSVGGSITLYAQWDPITITYDPNGATAEGTTASPTMGDQTIASADTEVTLWASNFKRNNYGFAGWNTAPDGKGTSYGPNQTITDATTLNNIKANGLTLYAMWKESQGDLQSWTPASCSAMNIGDTTALTDTRDGNTYAIAKLADGKCWMIENLRLSNTHTKTGAPVTINSTNTNNPTSDFTSLPASSSNWCTDFTKACIDQQLLNTNNTANTIPTMTNPDSNVYSYGNYYNWYTATAGNGTYFMTSGNTAGDICPAGWHLPKGDTAANGGEFSALDIAMGGTGTYQSTAEASNRWRTFPNNNLYSGYVNGSSVYNQGSYGGYWSSTAVSSYYAYELHFYSSGVGQGTTNWIKNRGDTVRCVLSANKSKITYNPNGATAEGTTASPTMGDQTIASTDTEVTLWASNFKRLDYGFAGWSTIPLDPNSSTFQADLKRAKDNNQVYGPNQTITDINTISSIKNYGLTLYAIWIQSTGDLQSWTPASCSAMNIGDTTALTDNRDGNTYAIAKLADGKCWMIENLRLSNTHTETGVPVAINSTNTNNPASGFSLGNPTDTWCYTNDAACVNQSLYNTVNTQDTVTTMANPDSNIYSYGNYYNWYTATAGNGTYSTSTNNTSVAGDICPAGWRLPKGGDKNNETNNDYWNLIVNGLNNGTKPNNYSSSSYPYFTGKPEGTDVSKLTRSYPNNFAYSGYANGSSVYNQGSYGVYWSSTTYSGNFAYASYVNYNVEVGPGTGYLGKSRGDTVRCVAGS